MSNDASRRGRRRNHGRRVPAAGDRHARHLELVTENWVAALADLAVLPQRAIRPVDGPRATVTRLRGAQSGPA